MAVKVAVPPAVTDAGPETVTVAKEPAFTVMPVWEPVVELVTVSVAVIDCEPAVSRVTVKVPTPLVRPALAGRTALLSLEVILTVPVYPVAVFPYASLAVTVTEPAVPAVTEVGKPETTRLVALAAFTVSGAVPVTPETVAVTVQDPAVCEV